MADYTKTQAPLVVNEDADSRSIKFWRHLSGSGNTNHCTIDLPGLPPDDATIAEFWPLAADRAALAALLAKGVRSSLARRGLTVVP